MIKPLYKQKKVWNSTVAKILSKKWNYLEPEEVIASLARNLRKKHKIIGPVVKLERVLSALNISLKYETLSLDAVLRETPEGYEIIVNSSRNNVRQRFSIAHEIGHIELFKSTGLSESFGKIAPAYQKSREAKDIEELCDIFASEFLMPMEEWRGRVFQEGVSFKVIKRLMSRYKVSFQAAVRKIIETDIWNCAIIIWKPVHNKENTKQLDPLHYLCKRKIGKGNWPDSISIQEEILRKPGSPVYTLYYEKEAEGKFIFNFLDEEESYFAQSSIIHSNPIQIATLIIAERDPKALILKGNSNRKGKIDKSQLKIPNLLS